MAKYFTNQHIVPKRYLDRFGEKADRKIIIGTLLKGKGKLKFFTASTEDVGYIKNYYDVTDKSDSKYWEHFFAIEIDRFCGRDMENIIAKAILSPENAVILSESDKEVLSKVINAQMMRIPYSVDYVAEKIYPRVSKQVKDNLLSALPPSFREKYEEQIKNVELSNTERKEVAFNHIFAPENFDRYCNILKDGIWVVYVNTMRNYMPFVTSDNPVLVEGLGRKKIGLFNNGIATPSTCIFYPLSPLVAVGIYSRKGFCGISADKLDGRKKYLNELKFIINKNSKIIDQAYHHSFFPQPLFDIISEKG